MSANKQTNSKARPDEGRGSGTRALVVAAAISALAAGCGSAAAAPAATSSATAAKTSATPTPVSPEPDTPSASALMVCGPEIQKAVTTILTLTSPPTTTTSWTDHLYTCTYHLPTGRLVLSVNESPDSRSANDYFALLRQKLGVTHALTAAQGLGNPGYESTGGTTVILKDGKTLMVDATGMPPVSGPHMISRVDLAYEIASDVLGCWSE